VATFVSRSIACPSCNHVHQTSLVISLNAVRRPDLVEEVVSDQFQRIVCAACGTRFEADDPFVYIDFDHKLWIACLPARGEQGWHRYEQESQHTWEENMLRNAAPLVRKEAAHFSVRTVFGLTPLRDKLVTRFAGLDDRWLEVLKLLLMIETENYGPGWRPHLWNATEDKLWFTLPNQTEMLVVARSRYTDLVMDPLQWIQVLESVSCGPYVDVGRLMIGGERTVEGVTFPYNQSPK